MKLLLLLPIILCAGCCDKACLCPDRVSTTVCHGWKQERVCCYDDDPNGVEGDFETTKKDNQVCVKVEWKLRN